MSPHASRQVFRPYRGMPLVRPGKVLAQVPPAAAEEFKVKAVLDDYLRCRKWDGSSEGTADEYIFKPFLLRTTPFDSFRRNRVLYDYSGLHPDTGDPIYVQNNQRRLARVFGDSRDFNGALVEERWIEEIWPTYYAFPLPEVIITPVSGDPIVIPADTADPDIIVASGLRKPVEVVDPEGATIEIKWIEVTASREWRVTCVTHSDDNVVVEP